MKSKDNDEYLLELILGYCEDIEEALELFGNDYEIFMKCVPFQNACTMPIFQIGELCKRISDDLKEENPQIDWRGLCGIRDIFAHQYLNLDVEITWDMMETELPQIKKFCKNRKQNTKK